MQTINIDRIVRRKDFDGVQGLKVTSMFRTIQGEGPYTGHPSVFLRLAGCNFGDKKNACQFCDTSFEIDRATTYGLSELREKLLALDGYNPRDVLVVTGGEPTLQAQLIPFMRSVYTDFSAVQVETNGTQAYFFKEMAEINPYEPRPCFVVSPKASHKLHGYAALSPIVLDSADCLKFVVSADPNDPHHTIPQWALDFANDGVVYVSPMAIYKKAYLGEVSSIWDDDLIDREKTAQNYAYAAQYAMKHNLHLSLQTHLFTAIP